MYLLWKKARRNRAPAPAPKPCVHQQSAVKDSGTSREESKAPLASNSAAPIHEVTTVVPPQAETETEKATEKSLDGPSKELPSTTAAVEITTPCEVCKTEKRAARRYRWILIGGLFFPFSLAALDATIIASALPFIASDFHELSQLNWIVSSFNLTSATLIPAWGQFADIFGRHFALQAALVLMLVGSTLCSASPTTAFPMLLVGRALQGISCSGINILTKIILADKVSLKENAKNNTIFALVGGIGYALGPVIGGYLTETTLSWRWCFIINMPVALIGMVAAFFFLRPELLGPQNIPGLGDSTDPENKPSFKAKLATVDFGGQFFFLFGMGLLVLALTWGGSYYPWSDARVLAPLIIGVILSITFLIWEYLMVPGRILAVKYPRQMAMVSLDLVWSRNAGLLMYINFITGMALFAVFYFVDLYFALVQDYPPGKAGIQLLYYTPGLGIGAYIAMFACNIYPLQTWFPLAFGTVIEPLGITILAVAIGWDNLPVICGMLGLTGVGTGVRMMPGTLHGVGYYPNAIASIVSLMSLAISLGSIFAMTVMFTVFNNRLNAAGINFKAGSTSSFSAISGLAPTDQAYLRDQSRSAISVSFFALCAFLWLGIPAVMAMGNVNITKGLLGQGKDKYGGGDGTVKGSFLGSVFLRKRKGAGKKGGVATDATEVEPGAGAVPEGS